MTSSIGGSIGGRQEREEHKRPMRKIVLSLRLRGGNLHWIGITERTDCLLSLLKDPEDFYPEFFGVSVPEYLLGKNPMRNLGRRSTLLTLICLWCTSLRLPVGVDSSVGDLS